MLLVADFTKMKARNHMKKWVYNFGDSGTDGTSSMLDLLGGKGANLAEMSSIGLWLPGFTISTEVCAYFYANEFIYPDTLKHGAGQSLKLKWKQVCFPIQILFLFQFDLETVSMPGMMDTILNLGLNDVTAAGLLNMLKTLVSHMIVIVALSKCMVMLL